MKQRPKNPDGPKEQRPGGKVSTSFRLSPESLERIDWLAAELHITKSAVVELAVRDLEKRERKK